MWKHLGFVICICICIWTYIQFHIRVFPFSALLDETSLDTRQIEVDTLFATSKQNSFFFINFKSVILIFVQRIKQIIFRDTAFMVHVICSPSCCRSIQCPPPEISLQTDKDVCIEGNTLFLFFLVEFRWEIYDFHSKNMVVSVQLVSSILYPVLIHLLRDGKSKDTCYYFDATYFSQRRLNYTSNAFKSLAQYTPVQTSVQHPNGSGG